MLISAEVILLDVYDLHENDRIATMLSPAHGKVRGQVRLMDGVNANTVWTWNAIGKRAGAWNLSPDSPEATKGFLLNHLISELLPRREGGHRYSNSDPVTGQAAWYDLRVKVERIGAADTHSSAPEFAALDRLPGLEPAPEILRFGEQFKDNPSGGWRK